MKSQSQYPLGCPSPSQTQSSSQQSPLSSGFPHQVQTQSQGPLSSTLSPLSSRGAPPLSSRSAAVNTRFTHGDVLVLFGELFNRGYANGLVEEARRRGLTVIHTTVGRRDRSLPTLLRPLNEEELAEAPKPLINIPLEAGFDQELDENTGLSVMDLLREIKSSEWENFSYDPDFLERVRQQSRKRFRDSVRRLMEELEPLIPSGSNVYFAHLMAGGVPKAKVILGLLNRMFKTRGDRHLGTQTFWESPLGKICEANFSEVTANTFSVLVEESKSLRSRVESRGGQVVYSAYGYHGTRVFLNNEYLWQTYTPYVQGWAKLQLEELSKQFQSQGLRTCVFNCPEILTGSSNLFSGVELSLYALIDAIQRESRLMIGSGEGEKTPVSVDELKASCEVLLQSCRDLLQDPQQLDSLSQILWEYQSAPPIRERSEFSQWPQHSTPEQMELMLMASDRLVGLHKDSKQLITTLLSEVVIGSCGRVMFENADQGMSSPVTWIDHDRVARSYLLSRRMEQGTV